MTWVTTTEVGQFLERAEQFLVADPIANTALLTEAHFWSRLNAPGAEARFGWWVDSAEVDGAFAHLPGHAPICSPLSPAAAAALPGELAGITSLGVAADDVAAVTAAWRTSCGQALRPVARFTLLRLAELRHPPFPPGNGRVANASDLPLLRSWFRWFQERHPDDPSQVEFVIDQPLHEGGVIVWEVDGRPVAMASRTVAVAGMARMGLAFQPTEGAAYADAAFATGCAAAARSVKHVLVLSGTRASTAAYSALGFIAVLNRTVLEVERHLPRR